jgi:hypothetical protein
VGARQRISAIQLTGSYALGSAAWAVIGPIAGLVGAVPLLAFGAGYAALSGVVPCRRSDPSAGSRL